MLHELTHLRRHDLVIKWLAALSVYVHWFNPISYLVRRELDRACELACDEAVINDLDNEGKQAYGDTLIAMAADAKNNRLIVSTTMCEEKRTLKERLGAIMKSKKISKKAIVLSCALLAIVICAVVILGSAGRGAADGSEGDMAPAVSDAAQPGDSQGASETFTYGNLILEISNVSGVSTESKLDDGLAPYEQTVFTCYPGAELSVVNADMSDPAYTADGSPHAQWGLYDIKTDRRTELTDKTEPMALQENTGVVNLESSLLLLVFEFAE